VEIIGFEKKEKASLYTVQLPKKRPSGTACLRELSRQFVAVAGKEGGDTH